MLRRALPLLILVAATLTACDDPSNVGLGLVGDDSGQPVLHRTPPLSVEPSEQRDAGGGTTYVLAGRTSDPLLGDIEAVGYVDFSDPRAFGRGDLPRFRDNPVTGAYLELPRAYLYGDSLSSVAFSLREMTREFAMLDSTFEVGPAITSFTYSLPDTTVRVMLPASWVTANDSTLRGTTFATSFHGFQLSATSGNAVIGFVPAGVRLFATTAQDTVAFSASKNAFEARRLSAPSLPPGYVALQDGVEADLAAYPQVSHRYRIGLFDPAQVSNSGLSRLTLEVAYDSVLAAQTPPHYVRPQIGTLEVLGVDEDEDVLFSGPTTAFLRALGSFRANGRITFSHSSLNALGQMQLLGLSSPVKGLILQSPQALGTLNALILRAPDTEDAPSYVLTVVPTD